MGGSGGTRWNDSSKTEGARFIAMAIEKEQRKEMDRSMVRCGTIYPSVLTSKPRLSTSALVAARSEEKGWTVPPTSEPRLSALAIAAARNKGKEWIFPTRAME